MIIPAVPRRQFLITAMAASAGSIIPAALFAQHEGDQLVQQIRAAAAEAKISVQSLRSGINVLIGSAEISLSCPDGTAN